MSYGSGRLIVFHTLAEWAASTYVLNSWELGMEIDTGAWKLGDGTSLYADLAYLPSPGGGGGDMFKATYDSDSSGTVDDSEALEGQPGSYYLDRTNHTGSQLSTTISDFTTAVDARVALFSETDPVFSAWLAGPPDLSEFNNDVGYLTSETISAISDTGTIDLTNSSGTLSADFVGDTGDVPEGSNLYFTDTRVRATVLTGLSITGGTIAATDTVLQAFGKLQNQVNAIAGGVTYQGVWNATTNSPALASGVGTKGYYYVVNPAGSTTLDGISSWGLGDWVIFNGTAWEKVDNTDAVISVNGFTGAVLLTTADVADSTNKRYVTDAQLVVIGNTSGTNTGDQTSIVGISGTKAQYNTSCSDGDFLFVGDIVGVTDSDKGDVVVTASGATWSVESTSGAFRRLNAIYPAQIAAATHNYNPTGFSAASVIYINSDADSRNISGIVAAGDGDVKTFINNGSFKIIFSNENASSTDVNRIHCSSSFSIPPDNGFVTLQYEGGSMNRWRPIAWNTAAGGDLAGSNFPVPTITTNAVTYAKMQDVSAASKLIGRGSASGSGDPEEITLGTNLTMSTTTLNAQSTSTCGVATSPTASQTDSITHSLGRIPKIIRIYGIGTFTSNSAATPTTHSVGVWNTTGNRCVFQGYNTGGITTTQAAGTSTTFAIRLDTGANSFITGIIQNVGATTFDIAWTETGTATAQSYLWEAE